MKIHQTVMLDDIGEVDAIYACDGYSYPGQFSGPPGQARPPESDFTWELEDIRPTHSDDSFDVDIDDVRDEILEKTNFDLLAEDFFKEVKKEKRQKEKEIFEKFRKDYE